jgi:hypothetical protein
MSSDPPNKDQPQNDPSKSNKKREEDSLHLIFNKFSVFLSRSRGLEEQRNRSGSSLSAAGFHYTDNSRTNPWSFTSPLLASAHFSCSPFTLKKKGFF